MRTVRHGEKLIELPDLAVRVVLPRWTEAPAIQGTFKRGVGFYWLAYAAGWNHGNISLKGLIAFPSIRICDVH